MIKTGEMIQKLRLQADISAADLAFKLGITEELLSKWETGEMLPPPEAVYIMADIFGISYDTIVGNAAEIPEEIFMTRLTKEDIKESNKMYYGGAYLNFGLTAVLFMVMFILGAFIDKNNPLVYVLFGAITMFILSWAKFFGAKRKRTKQSIADIAIKQSAYEVFSDRICVRVFKNYQQIDYITLRCGDIEKIQSSKTHTVLHTASRLYILRNDIISAHKRLEQFILSEKERCSKKKTIFEYASVLFYLTLLIVMVVNAMLPMSDSVMRSYVWLYLLTVPWAVTMLIYVAVKGKHMPNRKEKMRSVILAVCILAMLFVLCISRSNTSLYYHYLSYAEQECDLNLIENNKVIFSYVAEKNKWETYGRCYFRGTVRLSDKDNAQLLHMAEQNDHWLKAVPEQLEEFLPSSYEATDCEYFLLYNISEDTFNIQPADAEEYYSDFLFMCYDCDSSMLYIRQYIK